MFTRLTFLTAAIAITANSVTFAADEDLFSEFSSTAVFSSTADSTAHGSKSSLVPKRVKTTEELRDLIKTANFDAKVASARAVSTEKVLDPWTFPVLLVMSEDETTITIVLGLSTVKDAAKELPAATLLKMMQASQDNAPALFSFHAKRERTELSIVLKNNDLSGQMLRDEVNRLAVLAKKTSDVWANTSQAEPLESTASTTPVAEEPVKENASLTGKWVASKSDKEAFAVEFKQNGTFALVYINDGQQTKSSGKFTTENGTLVLSGTDGLKLQGSLKINSDKEFTFTPTGSTALTFTKS